MESLVYSRTLLDVEEGFEPFGLPTMKFMVSGQNLDQQSRTKQPLFNSVHACFACTSSVMIVSCDASSFEPRAAHVAVSPASALKTLGQLQWGNVPEMVSFMKTKQSLELDEPESPVRWTTMVPGDMIYIPPHCVVVSKIVHSTAIFLRVQAAAVCSQRVTRAAREASSDNVIRHDLSFQVAPIAACDSD